MNNIPDHRAHNSGYTLSSWLPITVSRGERSVGAGTIYYKSRITLCLEDPRWLLTRQYHCWERSFCRRDTRHRKQTHKHTVHFPYVYTRMHGYSQIIVSLDVGIATVNIVVYMEPAAAVWQCTLHVPRYNNILILSVRATGGHFIKMTETRHRQQWHEMAHYDVSF